MAMFTEKGHGQGDAEAGLSIIGTGMRVVGDITAEGVVKVEGTVVGTVRAGRQVLVAKGGTVEGDVMAREAIVGGEVRGSIQAEERVEIQTASVVHGDIATKRLLVQEGGEINGVIRMGEAAGAADVKRGSRPAALGTASTSASF
jgi:cytoskeletal protein CcmA (bactofilin family)